MNRAMRRAVARAAVDRRSSEGRKGSGDEVRAARRVLAAQMKQRAQTEEERSVEERLDALGFTKGSPRIFKPGDKGFEVPKEIKP